MGSQKITQFIQSSVQHLRRHAEGLPQGDGILDVSYLHHCLESDGGNEEGQSEGFRRMISFGMNGKDRGRVRSFLRPFVPETKPSEFAGDGKASVFGGGIDIDADEKVLRIENARLETKVIAALDAQPQTACIFLRIDGDVAVPMLIDQSLCEGLGPVFFEPLLCKYFKTPSSTVLFRPL